MQPLERYLETSMILFLVIGVLTTHAAFGSLDLSSQWTQFKQDFNKIYPDENKEQYRRSVWTEQVYKITKHNQLADQGVYTYWLKINNFADLTDDEVLLYMHGFNVDVQLPSQAPPKEDNNSASPKEENTSALPKEGDNSGKYDIKKKKKMKTFGLALGSRDLSSQWTRFKQEFNKSYSDEYEEQFRRSIWTDQVNKIAKHNEQADQGVYTYWLKINNFADLTDEEVRDLMHGFSGEVKLSSQATPTDQDKSEEPKPKKKKKKRKSKKKKKRKSKNVDWRKKGYVTPVKNQGKCASCYAFAATGALEGQHFRKTGKLVSLSEQNIIDCTMGKEWGNNGCASGQMDISFEYVLENNGIDTEETYPYEAKVGDCRFNKSGVGSKARGFRDVLPRGNEKKLMKAVKKLGPISAGISDNDLALRHYSHGVFDNDKCDNTRLNHAVLIVGYGKENGIKYWLVKNSWGDKWGLDGYAKTVRDKKNQCGLASRASYPIV